ncbi:MAG TPA: hypothetical protein VG965_02290 [Patescibacteria group bacterium]|nr:hypothetical protein [Patescibacteria group bacterium]
MASEVDPGLNGSQSPHEVAAFNELPIDQRVNLVHQTQLLILSRLDQISLQLQDLTSSKTRTTQKPTNEQQIPAVKVPEKSISEILAEQKEGIDATPLPFIEIQRIDGSFTSRARFGTQDIWDVAGYDDKSDARLIRAVAHLNGIALDQNRGRMALEPKDARIVASFLARRKIYEQMSTEVQDEQENPIGAAVGGEAVPPQPTDDSDDIQDELPPLRPPLYLDWIKDHERAGYVTADVYKAWGGTGQPSREESRDMNLAAESLGIPPGRFSAEVLEQVCIRYDEIRTGRYVPVETPPPPAAEPAGQAQSDTDLPAGEPINLRPPRVPEAPVPTLPRNIDTDVNEMFATVALLKISGTQLNDPSGNLKIMIDGLFDKLIGQAQPEDMQALLQTAANKLLVIFPNEATRNIYQGIDPEHNALTRVLLATQEDPARLVKRLAKENQGIDIELEGDNSKLMEELNSSFEMNLRDYYSFARMFTDNNLRASRNRYQIEVNSVRKMRLDAIAKAARDTYGENLPKHDEMVIRTVTRLKQLAENRRDFINVNRDGKNPDNSLLIFGFFSSVSDKQVADLARDLETSW